MAATDTTAPTTPTGLGATANGAHEIDLAWTASTDAVGVTSYKIYRGGTYLTQVAGTVTSLADVTPAPSTAYSYTVSALDAAGNASAQSSSAGATTTAASTYASTILADSPAVYWRLGEASGTSAIDATGHAHTGTYAATTLGAAGALIGDSDTAATFNGTSSAVAFNVTAGIPTGNTARTLEAWVKTTSTTASDVIGYGTQTTNQDFALRISASGGVSFQSHSPTNAFGGTVNNGAWHLVDLTYDGTTMKAYIDGAQQGSSYTPGTLATGTGSGRIAVWSAFLAATIDEPAIYGTALSASQVLAHYNARTSSATDTTAPTTPTGLGATANGAHEIDLAWTASTDAVGVTSYKIYRGGTYLTQVAGTVTSLADVTPAPSTAYSYTVSALDAAGNASAQSSSAGATTTAAGGGSATATYSYDPVGHVSTVATTDGITERATYDRAGQLLEIANTETGGTLSRFTYGLDAIGNRIEQTTMIGTTYYSYDSIGRLTDACTGGTCVPGGAAPLTCLACVTGTISRPAATVTPNPSDLQTTYAYDAVGNRLTSVNYLGTTTSVYDAADRLTSATPPSGPIVNYSYDANENELTAGTATYTYDLADRMHSAVVGGATTTYGWSGDGIRLSSSTGAGAATTNFLVDRASSLPNVAIERDGTGAVLARSAYGLTRLVVTVPADGALYEHTDALGSVTDLSSASGVSLAWSEFAPFGEVRRAGSAGGATTDHFGFAGQYLDPTGLYFMRARQYDAVTGRFSSTDPQPSSLKAAYSSTYLYALGNPVSNVDPSGRWTAGPCVELSGVLGLFGASGTLCFIVSSSVEAAFTLTGGGAAATGADVGVSAGVQLSTADHPYQVGGPFVSGSAGAGVGPHVTGGMFQGLDGQNNVVTGGYFGVGVGAGTASSLGVTSTTVAPIDPVGFVTHFNPFNVFQEYQFGGSFSIPTPLGRSAK